MSLQAFVWAIRTLTFLVAGAFGLLIVLLDPDLVGIYGNILFYLLGGLFFFGLSYLVLLGTYRLLLGDERVVHLLGTAARQAALLVLGGSIILWLNQNNLWYWWSILLVAAFLLLLEMTLREAGATKDISISKR